MEKDKELQENKPTNIRLKMTIGILFLVVLSIVELYLMMNYSDSYLFLGLVGLAILCFVYWVTDLSFKIHREQESSFEKDMESLYKAQKVSYITVKQGFAKLEELLDDLGEELSFPVDEVLQAQKAVGRVTIQKNKENIDAVVESNEKLIAHLQAFEQKFTEIADRIDAISPIASASAPQAAAPEQQEAIQSALTRIETMLQEGMGSVSIPDHQQEILDSLAEIEDTIKREFGKEPVPDRQQEILDHLTRIESSVRNEISELEVHMESKIDEIPLAVQEEQKMSPEELDKILGETSTLMDSIHLEMPQAEESHILEDTLIPETAEMSEDLMMPEAVEAPEDLAMPETVEAPEVEIAADENGITGDLTMPEMVEIPGSEITEEAGITGDLTMPETVEMPGSEITGEMGITGDLTMPEMVEMPGAESMSEEAQTSHEELALEGEAEEFHLPEMPEGAAESEKVLTPEEVAALLGDTGEPEAAAEEEEAPMPDLSDPGHVMTPEEIAALLVNM